MHSFQSRQLQFIVFTMDSKQNNDKKRKRDSGNTDSFKIPMASKLPKLKKDTASKTTASATTTKTPSATEIDKKATSELKEYVKEKIIGLIQKQTEKGEPYCFVDTQKLLTATLRKTAPGEKFITKEVKWFRDGLSDYTVRGFPHPDKDRILYIICWHGK